MVLMLLVMLIGWLTFYLLLLLVIVLLFAMVWVVVSTCTWYLGYDLYLVNVYEVFTGFVVNDYFSLYLLIPLLSVITSYLDSGIPILDM